MNRKIITPICITVFTVLFFSLILMLFMIYEHFSEIHQNQLKVQTELASNGISKSGIEFFNNLNMENCRITWIASDGKVIFDTDAEASLMENHLDRIEIEQALTEGYGESSHYSNTLTKRLFYTAQRLPDGTVVRLSSTQYTIWIILLAILRPILIVVIIAVIFSFIISILLSKKFVTPFNESMRREFTANVSHELKTPLHSISGYAELLKNDMVQQDDIAQFSERIYTEAQRMIVLVDDIINLSHLDEGAEDLQHEETDLFSLADETVLSLQPKAKAAGINMSLTGESAVINGIPQLLKGIIFNLCDNAVKYNRKDGNVDVSIKDEGNYVILSVKDTGIGIPKEHHNRIFERFYRVDKSHSKEVGGTGLGLSIVKHAARLHKAEIKLDSVVDCGTSIIVKFPKI